MKAKGVTLIELVVVVVILGILAAFVAPILSGAVNSYDYTSRNIELLTNMRYTMERIGREIRAMRRDPIDSDSYDIMAMSATSLEFCTNDGYRVGIALSGSQVKVGYTSGFSTACAASSPISVPSTLTDNVSAFSLTYFTSSGGSASNKSNVAFIDIGLTVTRSGANTYTSAMRVDMRNP